MCCLLDSDAFGQKFSRKPTLVEGFSNLFCMEIDPKAEAEDVAEMAAAADSAAGESAGGMGEIMKGLSSAIPGIDEAMSFAQLMKNVQSLEHEITVFDTAPTGHTLRLLSFPDIMDGALGKFDMIKDKFGPLISGLMGGQGGQGALLGALDDTKLIIDKVSETLKNPDKSTFVCVCIPEFLSLYETERLVQELANMEIDTHNIVVNQVLFPEPDSTCKKCLARQKMQSKYLDQIYLLYEDFHVVETPLLDEEVRGADRLKMFGKYLMAEDELVEEDTGGAAEEGKEHDEDLD